MSNACESGRERIKKREREREREKKKKKATERERERERERETESQQRDSFVKLRNLRSSEACLARLASRCALLCKRRACIEKPQQALWAFNLGCPLPTEISFSLIHW